jgi:flap endonuclease-1
MSELSGKKIVVDISIYLYKYESENSLLENVYSMLSIFNYYNIIPIFIFDGKPPIEKKKLLKKRRQEREIAQEEYNKLKLQLDCKINNDEKQDIITLMDQLKTYIVQINKEKIEKVKSLIRAYGATYYDAIGEADELCALLVIKKKAWACLSEDTDLFVYGCTRVLRYFSLLEHTVVLYNTKSIYNELGMSEEEFKKICVLSGTDYNISGNNISLNETMKYFQKFKKTNEYNCDFYVWLSENTDYINDVELLNKIKAIFTLDVNNKKLENYNNINIVNGPVRRNDIKAIMKEADFIFCN